MDEIKKMLRAVINGQSSLRADLLGEIKKLDKRMDGLETKVDDGFKKVHQRIDRIGKQLAYLDDDAPSGEEFQELKKRVDKLEKKIAS